MPHSESDNRWGLILTLATTLLVHCASPAGAQPHAVQWITVKSKAGEMRAAVARPQGKGPFPALLILHGSHGFAEEYVQLAEEFASHGFVAVAPCWFSGSAGAGARFIHPIACPGAPPRSDAWSPAAQSSVDTLLRAVRTLSGVRRDRVAILGHSRGAGTALFHVLGGGDVQAVVLNSCGYPDEVAARAAEVHVPILILHGKADDPADGGSARTNVNKALAFEQALRRAGRVVEATYYDGGHNSIFADPVQHRAEVERAAEFLTRYLTH